MFKYEDKFSCDVCPLNDDKKSNFYRLNKLMYCDCDLFESNPWYQNVVNLYNRDCITPPWDLLFSTALKKAEKESKNRILDAKTSIPTLVLFYMKTIEFSDNVICVYNSFLFKFAIC